AAEHAGWNDDPQRFGDFLVDRKLVLDGRLYRQGRRALAVENLIDICRGTPELIDKIGAVGNQATAAHVKPGIVDHRQPVPKRERIYQIPVDGRRRTTGYDQATIRIRCK